MKPPVIKKLRLRNYKSVRHCVLEFEPLTILVGRNAAGKSNIIDALKFLRDAIDPTLEFALRERGGVDQVRCRSLGGRPRNFEIEVELAGAAWTARYGFCIAAVEGTRFEVARERCLVDKGSDRGDEFEVQSGRITRWTPKSERPQVSTDRLLLAIASGMPEFRQIFDTLLRMAFHNLNPEAMKRPQTPQVGIRLAYDGRNLASVIKELKSANADVLGRVVKFVQAMGVPITRVDHRQLGVYETTELSQDVGKSGKVWQFDASSMSDGTLRALGIFVSLLSARASPTAGASLVAIEEPETSLHPAAAGALVDALLEAAEDTQVVLSCHSPDLLDRESIPSASVRAVINTDGFTEVGRIPEATQELLQRHLFSAGELLRQDQLTPDLDWLRFHSKRSDFLKPVIDEDEP